MKIFVCNIDCVVLHKIYVKLYLLESVIHSLVLYAEWGESMNKYQYDYNDMPKGKFSSLLMPDETIIWPVSRRRMRMY